jgi:CDP-glucose 4,6-dehydratase
MAPTVMPDRRTVDVGAMNVLVTGHTGFKGAWLAEWLLQLGARVSGIALPPEHDETPFVALRHARRLNHTLCDIRDARALAAAVRVADPELVFHLAAQPLVLRSYRDPLLTWDTNVTGTLNLLEALRALDRVVTVIVVTTDKVYVNREWEYPYREDDELGGRDPYSASKAACEVAVASWRASFGARDGVTVVTARAGNVIGGGDQSADRLVPDCFRAWRKGETVRLRHPSATRPWQHVLEPLSGYLVYAAHARSTSTPVPTCNFGPGPGGNRTVEAVVDALAERDPARRRWTRAGDASPHEARTLSLAIDRARDRLGWTPRMTFEQTIAWTEEGYMAGADGLALVVERQIADYEAMASRRHHVGAAR